MDYVKIYQAAAQNSKKTLDTAIGLNKVYQKIEDQTLNEKFGKIFIAGQFLSTSIISFNGCEIER
jgi:hypothetical protein